MITKTRFTLALLRMLGKFDKGDYLSAYRIAEKMTSTLCPTNARVLLFKAYLSVLLENEDLARCNLRAFYEVMDKKPSERSISEDDNSWILSFACYLRAVLAMEFDLKPVNGPSDWSSRLDSIDFSRVSELTKRMFPPQHIPDMKQYM
ncbi:hypothetical protein DZC52_01375 [Wenzhouxiangella sediminis]|uniref:Uncharacterized protein n=1 Tax=Wenzhouxiangella sediminis TaxID=1792836 RepID=A0A3E1KCK0_9GAMM|nr:hypothetical protein DZC52_01375 [Wenzhouxiangella sediminis]